MNYYPPSSPYSYQPPFSAYDMVFHPKYGYISTKSLNRKLIRRNVTSLSLVTFSMTIFAVIFSLIITSVVSSMNIALDYELYSYSEGIPTSLFFAMDAFVSLFATGLPFAIYLLACRKKIDISHYLRFDKINFFNGLLFALCGSGLVMLLNFPVTFFVDLVDSAGFGTYTYSSPEISDPMSIVIYMISVAVIPALFEEFAFRGVVLSALRKHGDFFAVMVSSMIFAFVHMSATAIPFALGAGIIMGYIYVRTNNLWITIVLHFINNANSALTDIIYQNTDEAFSIPFCNGTFYFIIALGLISLVILIMTKQINFRTWRNNPTLQKTAQASTGTKTLAVLTSPGFLMVVTICLITIASSVTLV